MRKFTSVWEAIRYIVWRAALAVCFIITSCSLISKLCKDGASRYKSSRGMIVPLLKEWDTIAAMAVVTLFIALIPRINRGILNAVKKHPKIKYYALGIFTVIATLGYWQLHWIPTQLESACRSGDMAQLQHVLTWGGKPDAYPFKTRRRTPLSEAVYFDQAQVVAQLLTLGAHDSSDDPLLHYAIRCGKNDPEIIQLLLDYGCDPLQKNDNGLTAIEHAEKKGETVVLNLLKKHLAQ